MKDHLRLILLTLSNSALFGGFLLVERFVFQPEIKKRLIDLNLEESADSKIIFTFLAMIIMAVLVNLVLMYRNHRRVNRQITELAAKLQMRSKASPHPSESAS
jgi:ABC-type molybdate transport system permease subunit